MTSYEEVMIFRSFGLAVYNPKFEYKIERFLAYTT